MSEYDGDSAQREIDRADDHVDREQWERERNCEHRNVVTYTYRDWYETGIPAGTQCEDCGATLPDQPETEANEPTRGTES